MFFSLNDHVQSFSDSLQVMGLVIILLLLMIKYQVTLSCFYEEELKSWP